MTTRLRSRSLHRATLGLVLVVSALACGTAATAPAVGGDAPRPAVGADTARPGEAPRAYLVRHAEKVTTPSPETGRPPDDPALTAAGSARAEALANLLAGAGIERLLATDTRRARDTAAPLAARLSLAVETYDARQLDALAAELRRGARTVLVVGHSNTTGELARALGGDAGPPIDDAEHDRLYVVDLRSGATDLRRYGEPSQIPAAPPTAPR